MFLSCPSLQISLCGHGKPLLVKICGARVDDLQPSCGRLEAVGAPAREKVGHPSFRAVGEASVPRAGWDTTLVGGTVFSSAWKSARQDRARLPKPCPVVGRRRRSRTSPEHRRAGRYAPSLQASMSARASRRSVLIRRLRWAYIGAKLGSPTITSWPALSRQRAPLTLSGESLIRLRRTVWGAASTAPVLHAQGCGQRSVRRNGAFRSPECGPRLRALRAQKETMAPGWRPIILAPVREA